MKQFVRDLATDRSLWDEYIDPSGEGSRNGRDDFSSMTTEDKMHMIVDLWPEDVRDDDEEGQRIISEIRAERARSAAALGRIGGRSTSTAKQRAAQKNGMRGGRPRKKIS